MSHFFSLDLITWLFEFQFELTKVFGKENKAIVNLSPTNTIKFPIG